MEAVVKMNRRRKFTKFEVHVLTKKAKEIGEKVLLDTSTPPMTQKVAWDSIAFAIWMETDQKLSLWSGEQVKRRYLYLKNNDRGKGEHQAGGLGSQPSAQSRKRPKNPRPFECDSPTDTTDFEWESSEDTSDARMPNDGESACNICPIAPCTVPSTAFKTKWEISNNNKLFDSITPQDDAVKRFKCNPLQQHRR